MKTYKGNCHCEKVQFEIVTGLDKAVECNCSICTKKGALHHRISPERFKLISGEDALSLYQFGDKTAKHWFCKYIVEYIPLAIHEPCLPCTALTSVVSTS